MSALSILYIGQRFGTSLHRAAALERLSHRVTVIDPEELLAGGRIVRKWLWSTGGRFAEDHVRRLVLTRIPSGIFDLAYVNGGELVGPALVRDLKARCGIVINYNNDDPFGGRDGRRWRLYHQSLPLYDLAVVVRECNVAEAYAAGARSVLRVLMSADEVAHTPQRFTEEEQAAWASDIAFIGTWMPERGRVLAQLVELGVPLSIFGDRWQRAEEWPVLRRCWRGPGMFGATEYARAVQCARVCLGLVSKGNRDQSTTRSFEIPLLGGVLCAERTREHSSLYREDSEAAFWSTAEECAEQCASLLSDPSRRRHMAERGRARCLANGTTNQLVLRTILDTALRSATTMFSGAAL